MSQSRADDATQVAAIEAAAEAAGVRVPVLVEIDVGMARCGVEPGPPVVALAERIAASKHLRFGGLQVYHGSAQHQRMPEQRAASIAAAADPARRNVEQLRGQRGLDCPIACGGAGTGTFRHEAASGVYTEIQAGSYAFMDADYARNDDALLLPPRPVRAGDRDEPRDAGAWRWWAVPGTRRSRSIPACPLIWERPGLRFVGASVEQGKISDRGLAPRRRSARTCAWCRGIATRPSIATTGAAAPRPGGVPLAGQRPGGWPEGLPSASADATSL